MTRILQFIDNLELGGKERQCAELVKVLSARGDYDVQIVCMRATVFFRELFALPRVDVRFLVRRVRWDPLVFGEFIKVCKAFQPDVITVWDAMTAIYAIPAAKLLRIRLVSAMTQEAPARISLQRAMITRSIFAAADAVVANSRAGLAAFRAPVSKTTVIHAGYDLKRARPAAARDEARHRLHVGQRLVVGMVAAFADRKDHPTFIAAAQLVLRHRRDVVFLMVGSGPRLAECEALVREEEKPHIRFLGQVEGPIEDVVNTFDIGVLATFTEGISNSILEYMALGKPVVATDGGGTSEVVRDGETGYLVEACNPERLAERILTLLADETLRTSMGACGRRLVESEFALHSTLQRFCALYDRLAVPNAALAA